jgi:hypothetical protein
VRDGVGDELVELLGVDYASRDEHRDSLDRGEQDEADALGLAGFEGAVGLALFFEEVGLTVASTQINEEAVEINPMV